MYNSSRAKEITTTKVATAGINENVTFFKAESKKSPNQGNPFIELTFKTSDGLFVTHTEWAPTKFEGMSDADLEAKYDTQYARMLQILECYYPEDQLNFNGETFVEFANWLVGLLENVDKSVLLRVKFVYNNKGFLALPSYAKFKFIERMDTKESLIKILNKDQLTSPVPPADKETVNPNPLNTSTTVETTANPNGLPF